MSKPIPYEPLGNYLLLSIDPPKEQSEGGIYIPVQAREKPAEGTIVKIGASVVTPGLYEGDKVVYTKHSEYTLRIDEQLYVLVAEPNLILRVPKGVNTPIESPDAA